MTKNYELDCRDLFECTHEPETPVSEDGEILYWLCRCGKRVTVIIEEEDKQKTD